MRSAIGEAAGKEPAAAAGEARNETDNVRYFVGRPTDGDDKPMLEQEFTSEPEALVIAFKNDGCVYFIAEYRQSFAVERNSQ